MKKKSQFAEHGGQARVLAVVGLYLFRPLFVTISLIVAYVSLLLMPVQAMAALRLQSACALMAGYDPASMQTSNLPQSQILHHDKAFVKNLKPNTCFLRICGRRELPEMSGNQHRLYMYSRMTANTTQAGEGTVGTGATVAVVNTTATIGNYADYINVSHMARVTAIDPVLENIQKELALRLGLSLSTLVRNVADGASNIDGSVAVSKAYNVPFGRSDITAAVQSLAGRDVLAFDQGRMAGIIHPFIVGDAINDTTNNSLTDILKRTAQGQEKLAELPAPDGDEVQVMEWGGVSFHQSTMVTQTANYGGHGVTALRTYIAGEDGLIAISLGKKEQAQIGNGDWRNLKLWMYKADEPSMSDPSRMIGGWTSYNVYFVATLPPDPTQRLRCIDSVSNIS